MANNPITSDSLTINFGDLMRVPISLRADAAANYPSMLSVLTPIQIAKAFPDYYKKQLPDVSNFVTANIEKKVAGGFSGYSSGGGGGGGGGGGWGDESTPKLSVDDMKKKLLEKGIDIQGAYKTLGQGAILEGDKRFDYLKSMSKDELKKAGLERTQDESGKNLIKLLPTDAASLSDEDIIKRAESRRLDPNKFMDPAQSGKLRPEVIEKYKGKTFPVTIRNNNMGAMSLKDDSNKFVTEMPGYLDKTPRPANEGGYYARYATPEHGVAAASRNLENYARKGITRPSDIVRTWARDGNQNYINTVVRYLNEAGYKVDGNSEVDLTDPKVRIAILKGKSAFESGAGVPVYTDDVYETGANYQFENPRDTTKPYTKEEIAVLRQKEDEYQLVSRQEELIRLAYGQSSSTDLLSSSVSPEKSREYLSEVAQRAQALTPEQEVERPSHMEGFVEFQGLDVKFKAGSGGRSEEFPSTPYGVYKLPGMSVPGDKLRGKFAAMRGEGNTEIINIPNRYDPALGRTRTEMQFHPAIAPRDIDGDDIKDLISQGCIAIDPSQYDEFMATYKKFYEENNGNVWLSVLPGPPGEPARFSITNKEPVASEIITTDQALSNFESTGVVSPETYSQAVAQMSDADKTEAFGSSTKAETSTEAVNKAVQDIGGPAALDAAEQSIVIPNQINPNLPGGEEAMAGKEDLKGVVFHKTPLSLDDLQAGKDPRDSTYGYNTAIISTYVDAKGNKITETQWKKLSKDDKLMYTEKAEVHQIRPEDVRPNQIRKTSDPDSPRSEEIGTELNNVNALGVVTIGSDSAAKQEAAQNYLAELLAKGKISEDALGSVYGHGEIQTDEERPFMDPGKNPEGSVMAESVRSNIDAIKKKAEELKKQNATSIETVPAQEQPVNIEKQAAEDVGSIFGPDGAIFNPIIEGSESTDDQEVKKFRTGGSPYTQDDEDLSVIDREGNLRWQMNSGEGVYVKPSSDEYADNKMQELSGQIDQITDKMQRVDNNTQQPSRKQSSIDSSANMRRAIENLSKVPETKKTNSISEAKAPAGTQHRAFSMSHFRPVQSRRLGERGSPNIP